jgi:hypothetical protein
MQIESRSIELKFAQQSNYLLQQHSTYRFDLTDTANRNLSKMGLAEIKLDTNDFFY